MKWKINNGSIMSRPGNSCFLFEDPSGIESNYVKPWPLCAKDQLRTLLGMIRRLEGIYHGS